MNKLSLILFFTMTTGSFTNMYASHDNHASQIRLYTSLSTTAKMWFPHSPVSSHANTMVTLITNYRDEKANYMRAKQENNATEMNSIEAKLHKCVTDIHENEKILLDALDK